MTCLDIEQILYLKKINFKTKIHVNKGENEIFITFKIV